MTKGLLCKKCNTFYEDPEEGFYWEDRVGNYRRPCKECIAEYNKQPEQYEKRLAANKRYQQSKKGQESEKRSRIKRRKKKPEREEATRQIKRRKKRTIKRRK